MRNRVVHIAKNFEEAEAWDIKQHQEMTAQELLEALTVLRKRLISMKYSKENGERFQRVYRVIDLE